MPRANRRRAIGPVAERAIYAKVVAAMDYPEPSTLVHHLHEARARRVSPNQLLGHWQEACQAAPADAAWNMYIHVPFCKSICSFCNYKRLRVSSRAGLDEYVAFIESEARLFSSAFANVKFGALYIGGGTPSVLAADQLRRLMAALHDCFSFAKGAQKNFEFDPMVMTPERFQVVKEFGFTRFSFGIQSIDVEVNALHNRGRQQRGHIDKQFRLLGEHDADSANVDFLLGLAGTTPEQMLKEIEQVLSEHRPHEVTVYFLYPTPEYVTAHFGGDYDRFKRHLGQFESVVPDALREMAERIEYRMSGDGKHVINMSNQRRRQQRHSARDQRFHYCDVPTQVHRPLYLLGFGDSARSRIFGHMSYRAEQDTHDPSAEGLRYVAFDTSMRDEMFSYIAFLFRDGRGVSRPLFRRTFGIDVLDVYRRQVEKLVSLGALTVTEQSVSFTPQSRRDMLRDLLFFLPAGRRSELAQLANEQR